MGDCNTHVFSFWEGVEILFKFFSLYIIIINHISTSRIHSSLNLSMHTVITSLTIHSYSND
jgi:hypothetical protein